ncbi:MAG TPA: hypothetical protein VJ438_01115 [Candidatus Nanoarchaeia archaeon]|nr:hypothetical protein [Candidatus Nanoarchaeia archaeon]
MIDKDGSVRKVTESLGECLMQDKTPGISLNSWIKTADYHGFPTAKTRDGNLFYLFPRDGSVARFNAFSFGAVFYCSRNPANRSDSLGVRVARKK